MNHSPDRSILPHRFLGTKNKKKRYWRGDVASFFCLRYLCNLTTTQSPAACHHFISRSSPLEPLCVSSCWITHEAESVKASVIYRAASRCKSWGNEPAHDFPCLACVLYLRFTLYPTYTCRPQDLQLYLSYRSILSSKSLGCMKPCRAGSITHVVACPL